MFRGCRGADPPRSTYITEFWPRGTRRRWVARLRPQVIALRGSELADAPLHATFGHYVSGSCGAWGYGLWTTMHKARFPGTDHVGGTSGSTTCFPLPLVEG